MAYANPSATHNPTTGVAIPASWGDAVDDQIAWLAGDSGSSNPKPMVLVRSSSGSQSIPNSVVTALNRFDNEQVDTASMWSFGSPSRITIPVLGRYLFGASCTFASNATGMRELSIRLNGGGGSPAYIAAQGHSIVGANDQRVSVVGFAVLSPADYLEAVVWQSSGGALDVTTEYGRSQTFWCAWIGHH